MPQCKVCNTELTHVYSLGDIPPINDFLLPEEKKSEVGFPLDLTWCSKCSLVQLANVVPPEKLFRSYRFMTSASSVSVKHMDSVADDLSSALGVSDTSKVLEIGSNDGTLLKSFKRYTQNVLGVDPAENLLPDCTQKGVESLPEFFTQDLAHDLRRKRGEFDLILALNVVAHTPNFLDLFRGVEVLLKPEGTFVMEFPYIRDTVLKGEFDTVYHEHVYQFSLMSICYALLKAGLRVFHVERVNQQGGSIRVFVTHERSGRLWTKNFEEMYFQEYEAKLGEFSTYKALGEQYKKYKEDLQDIVKKMHQKHDKIVGLGAPARGTVILNACEIHPYISATIDDTPLKQGRLVPGTNIPVISWDQLDRETTCFFLLSWNYSDAMLEKVQKLVKNADVIIPFPKLRVLNYESFSNSYCV